MYKYPENLFTDVRIERIESSQYYVRNNEVETNNNVSVEGARIRVYDGKMWYTSTTNDLSAIQSEIDNLATLATPNKDIYNDPIVRNFGAEKADVRKFTGENDIRNISRNEYEKLVSDYIDNCLDSSIEEIKSYSAVFGRRHSEKEYYSSKGAEIKQDNQVGSIMFGYEINCNGFTTGAFKMYSETDFDLLKNHYDEVIAERDRYLDFARNGVDVVPGEYTCVLAPIVTAMFTHESFGHKSESDFMLNDKTLQDEWVLGKKVGNDLVSICDRGDLPNNGYTPYDDEGNKATETWLIKNGVLTGRLHDSKSAAVLNENITGNARADGIYNSPIVRMTNTFMAGGSQTPESIIADIKDGIYVYGVNYGTGSSTFTMQPNLCYRIRDGKLAESVRANVICGNVFKTLFDIDAVGNDFTLFNTYTCGKNGQSVPVSAGGPTIRVKTLTVN